MSKLKWDQTGEKLFEAGVEDVALYVTTSTGEYGEGVAWNGITAVTKSPSGAEASPFYANNKKYLNIMSTEELAGSIEAYMYPDEFAPCIGDVEVAEGVVAEQQEHKAFGIAYKTLIGNDTDGISHGFKLKLIYGMLAAPSEDAAETINESFEPSTMSWDFSTTPVTVTTKVDGKSLKPMASVTIDSTKTDATKMAALLALVYGKDAEGDDEAVAAKLPTPDEVFTLVAASQG